MDICVYYVRRLNSVTSLARATFVYNICKKNCDFFLCRLDLQQAAQRFYLVLVKGATVVDFII